MQEIVAEQLARGDIDAGENRRIDVERVLPGGKFARGAFQRENAEIDNRAGLLGGRNEVGGAEPPETRMIPSKQRFEARNRAVLEPDDRLEKNFDFAAVKRVPQVRYKTETIRAQCAHRGPEYLDAIAAHTLAMPHCDFGIRQHVFARPVQLRIVEREADRGGERNFLVADGHRSRDAAANQIGETAVLSGLKLRNDQDDELVARKPGQRVPWFQDAGQPPREGEQNGIGGGKPGSLVDLLEPVDVEADDGGADAIVGLRER